MTTVNSRIRNIYYTYYKYIQTNNVLFSKVLVNLITAPIRQKFPQSKQISHEECLWLTCERAKHQYHCITYTKLCQFWPEYDQHISGM